MLDDSDRRLLRRFQSDPTLTTMDLAEQVGLSAAPCWRRVKRLEEEGYIQDYIAQLNPNTLGLQVAAFAEVSLDNHHTETLNAFNKTVESCPQILECHSVVP